MQGFGGQTGASLRLFLLVLSLTLSFLIVPMYMSSLATLSALLILGGKSTYEGELEDWTQQVGWMRVFGVKRHSSAASQQGSHAVHFSLGGCVSLS